MGIIIEKSQAQHLIPDGRFAAGLGTGSGELDHLNQVDHTLADNPGGEKR